MPSGQLSLLRESGFIRLWAASTASGLAHWAFPFALGVAVAQGVLSAGALGVILALRTVGFLAAVPIAGVVADRISRRRVMVVSAGLAALATVPAALMLRDAAAVSAIAAIVIGAGQGAYRPALQALLAEVVPPEQRQAANAANSLAVRLSILLGPAMVTGLSRFVEITALIAALAGLWALAALAPPSGNRRRHDPSSGRPEARPLASASAPVRTMSLPRIWRGFVRDLKEGVGEARRHPWFLHGLGALSMVIMFGYSATGIALPLISRERFGGDALLAAGTTGYTVGALAGAVVVAKWRPRNAGWHAMAGLGVYAVIPLSLAISPNPWLIVACCVLAGVGIEVFNVPWFTATQREVAPHALARVSSLDFLVSYGLAPLGLAALAPAMTALGETPMLLICAAVCVIAPALTLREPSTREFQRDGGVSTISKEGSTP